MTGVQTCALPISVIGGVTYEVGVHAILGSFCAGISSHIKTVIGGVTYEIGVHAILESFCAGFCSHIKTVFGADLLISSKTVT